ncbi:hypothetical protein F5Y16DRAFT_374943 [Xylariaceae sp. FL0255]|nr:hypothetical protein F5Y16DRAFT_374943 [Xylariaceae sp. FL0255]
MDWHDAYCRRLDLALFDGIQSCMSCGSFAPPPATETAHQQLTRPSDIRLLKLLSGDYDDELRGEVFLADLSSYPVLAYEAISYTWADETSDVTLWRPVCDP